jgi:hypothetical protein
MSQAVQTAVKVFTSKVRPVLRKWGYTVTPIKNELDYARWEIRWGDLADRIDVRYRKIIKEMKDARIILEDLLIWGGFYCGYVSPITANSKIILERFKNAVESVITFFCRRELERIYYGSKGTAVETVKFLIRLMALTTL